MEIILNGEKETVAGDTTVSGLLAGLELNPDIVTVSLNGRMLAREAFAASSLQPGDRVDIILFMGGGL
ncbi:hypothetical protein SY88_03745 [Clostridiales bacterium PH28_bin88]|nr:hypothetical protein SY88_03745 [Clostridiales bacterium PH28_bin88]